MRIMILGTLDLSHDEIEKRCYCYARWLQNKFQNT